MLGIIEMTTQIENWKTQIRKGYLDLCVLAVVRRENRIYGFDLLDKLSAADLPLKEGTLYPLLNRMTAEGLLSALWDTENVKGHPRKFYSLTRQGNQVLEEMTDEFSKMVRIYKTLLKG